MATLSIKAEASVFEASNFINENSKETYVQSNIESYDFELFDKEAREIFNSDKDHIVIKNFPIRPNYKVNLILSKQSSAFTKNVEINYFKDGKKVKLERPNKSKYYGSIEGHSPSDIFISYSSLGLVGYIQDETGQMYDISGNMQDLGKAIITHSVTETTIGKSLDNELVNPCGIDELPEINHSEYDFDIDYTQEKKSDKIQKTDLLEVKIAADGNFEFYLMFCVEVTGNSRNNWEEWYDFITPEQHAEALERTIDYIENVMSATSRIYVRELDIIVKAPYITIFTEPFDDPYFEYFGTSLDVKLSAMPNIWSKRSGEAIDRTLATVFTDIRRQPQGSRFAGIAMSGANYNGVLCQKNQGYSTLGLNGRSNFPSLSYSSDVGTTAHELGHNFGAPHTHSCYWQNRGFDLIDSCETGTTFPNPNEQCLNPEDRRPRVNATIMSYCHTFGSVIFNFHPRLRKQIRENAVEAMEFCVKIPSEPVVKLVSPFGNETYFGGSEINIKFNAANVPLSKLFFSTNNGSDWSEIGIVNTAEDTIFKWSVPYEFGDKNKVRIESLTDASIFDESLLPFRITYLSITAEFPKPNTKIGYLSDHNVRWSRNNVDNVTVKYSTDNGKTYETVSENINENSMIINFPDVATKEAILSVQSVDFSNTVLEVLFELGRESVVFNSPMLSDVLNINRLEHRVKFNQDFFDEEFDVWFRRNQTGNWVKLNNFINKVNLETNEFLWKFSSDIEQGDRGELEARLTSGEVVGETGVFNFDAFTSVGLSRSRMFNINSITPNPASNTFKLVISNSEERLVSTNIRIIGVGGKEYKNISVGYISTGKTPIEIDVDDLLVGTYYIMIESDKHKDVQQLKVVR